MVPCNAGAARLSAAAAATRPAPAAAGNHQTLALDLGPLCEQFLRERGVLLRGLAHPVIFQQSMSGPGAAGGSGGPGGSAGGSAAASLSSSSSSMDEAGAGAGPSGRSRGEVAPWDLHGAFGTLFSGQLGAGSDSEGSGSGGGGGPPLPLPPPFRRRDASATDGRSAFRDFMTTFGERRGASLLAFPFSSLFSSSFCLLLPLFRQHVMTRLALLPPLQLHLALQRSAPFSYHSFTSSPAQYQRH